MQKKKNPLRGHQPLAIAPELMHLLTSACDECYKYYGNFLTWDLTTEHDFETYVFSLDKVKEICELVGKKCESPKKEWEQHMEAIWNQIQSLRSGPGKKQQGAPHLYLHRWFKGLLSRHPEHWEKISPYEQDFERAHILHKEDVVYGLTDNRIDRMVKEKDVADIFKQEAQSQRAKCDIGKADIKAEKTALWDFLYRNRYKKWFNTLIKAGFLGIDDLTLDGRLEWLLGRGIPQADAEAIIKLAKIPTSGKESAHLLNDIDDYYTAYDSFEFHHYHEYPMEHDPYQSLYYSALLMSFIAAPVIIGGCCCLLVVIFGTFIYSIYMRSTLRKKNYRAYRV